MEFSALEWFSLVVLVLATFKLIWNICGFFYTTFIGSWLGLNLDLRNYGPWAGVTTVYLFLKIYIGHFFLNTI